MNWATTFYNPHLFARRRMLSSAFFTLDDNIQLEQKED